MKPRCAGIGGFLFLLAVLLSCAGMRRAETESAAPLSVPAPTRPDTAAGPAHAQPELQLSDGGGNDFALNLMDPASFSGGNKSFVIIDPLDRQKLKGFVRLPSSSLADLVSKYTGLHVGTGGHIDPMDLPIGGVGFGTSQVAVQDLVEYLRRGGFLLGVGEPPPDVRQALLKYAGLVYGIDYHSELLSPDHPIFHAYFDLPFESPGPNGELIRAKGFFLGERLVGVSEMPGGEWGIINTVVFALTQPGGIAKQYMRP